MKDSKNGWAWINALLGRKRKNANINELIIDDKVIYDDKSIAETFNEYFKDIRALIYAILKEVLILLKNIFTFQIFS